MSSMLPSKATFFILDSDHWSRKLLAAGKDTIYLAAKRAESKRSRTSRADTKDSWNAKTHILQFGCEVAKAIVD